MSFESFINNITPNNSSDVSISWNSIRNTITGKSNIISDSFLTGSYIRYTKIHPIDDLDIFFNIKFWNTNIKKTNNWIKIYISSNYDNHQLKDFSTYDYEDNRYYVSPVKLINHIWKLVKETYTTTNEQTRNWECYTVCLSSKNLTIDCVPYTWVTNEEYLLIPKWWNNLYWKKTNPKIDNIKINEINNSLNYNWKFKWVVKIIKYWNKYKNTGIKFKSYILESLIYYAFKEKCNRNMWYIILLKKVIEYIYNNVDNNCNIYDIPKYEYMYYNLELEQKRRIKNKLSDFYEKLKVWEYITLEYLEINN